MFNRVYSLRGVRNFRDFGGYPSTYGGKVRSECLFRSGHFSSADKEDLKSLNAFGIQLQADLRRPDERERMPGAWPGPDTKVKIIVSDLGREADAPHAQFLKVVEADASKSFNWMRDYYFNAPYKPQHLYHFKAWFEQLADLGDDSAALINCAAGKDRTGILCMLTHKVLGVSDDDIMADYLLTNQAAEVDARLSTMTDLFNERLGKTYMADIYRPFMGVDPAFLMASIAEIETRSGGIERYLSNDLGLQNHILDRVRQRFLMPD